MSYELHSSVSDLSLALAWTGWSDCARIRLKISITFSSSTFGSNDESSSLWFDEEITGGGIEGGRFIVGGMGGREEEEEEGSVAAGLLNGNATRLFKLIFKFPVGGGTNFGGSFQPDEKLIWTEVLILKIIFTFHFYEHKYF